MARKKVIDLSADNCVGFADAPNPKKNQKGPGQEVSGYYLGSRRVTTKLGESDLHILQLPTGENLGVWGSAQLNQKLGQIAKGNMVFIVYKKKINVPSGTMKTFEVEYDDEDSIHVDSAEVNFQAGGTEADTNDYQGDDTGGTEAEQEVGGEQEQDPEQEQEEAPPAPPVRTQAPRQAPKSAPAQRPAAASAPSSDARARANALLNKKR